MHRGENSCSGGQAGFTYILMLCTLAIFGIGLAAIGESWSAARHREKEEELILIGSAFVQAIASYHQRSPGSVKIYPAALADLAEDKRFVSTMRHIRRIYADPVTKTNDWGLVYAPEGGITGIYSKAEAETLLRKPFTLNNAEAISGIRYSSWKFVYRAKS
jgi:type II secretory pathway pseudopilin PulG